MNLPCLFDGNGIIYNFSLHVHNCSFQITCDSLWLYHVAAKLQGMRSDMGTRSTGGTLQTAETSPPNDMVRQIS